MSENNKQERTDLYQILSELSGTVKRLEANVETLFKGFDRLNRPWQWPMVISILMGMGMMAGTFATVLVLLTEPMRSDIVDLQEHQQDHMEFVVEDAHLHGRMEADIEWLKNMEARIASHHTDEWNRAKDSLEADLQGDLVNMHECAEKSKELIMELMQQKADKE